MGFIKSSSLLCLTLLLAFSSSTYGFNITKMLGKYPDLSQFSQYITEAKLADQINSRNTITVLAVDNGAISAIASKSPAAIKAIISTHVILDYFDEKKLMEAHGSGEQLTTLFQSSGLAVNKQGFLKVAVVGEGEIAFGSAAGGGTEAELVKTVTSEPYNISILQVTKPIIAPGVDSQTPSQGANAPAQAQSANAPKSDKAPVPSSKGAKAPSPAQAAKSPAPAKSAKAPAPSKTGDAPSPSTADSPQDAAEAPATSPVAADAPGPAADEEAASDVPASGSPSTTKMGLVGAAMAFAPLLIVW